MRVKNSQQRFLKNSDYKLRVHYFWWILLLLLFFLSCLSHPLLYLCPCRTLVMSPRAWAMEYTRIRGWKKLMERGQSARLCTTRPDVFFRLFTFALLDEEPTFFGPTLASWETPSTHELWDFSCVFLRERAFNFVGWSTRVIESFCIMLR